ncbi:MAG: EF-hand domain-containing protein [Paracoccaceae bacterium]
MKTMMLACASVAALLSAPVYAQQGNPGAHMLDQWDADGDGQVTLDEATTKRGEVFFMFDLDTDGTLSAEDWAGVAQHMADEMGAKGEGNGAGNGGGHNMGPGAAMHEAMTPGFNDADGDGTVTGAEFTQATQKLFPLLDRNADGVLTTADFGR